MTGKKVIEVLVSGPAEALDAVTLGLVSAGAVVDSPDLSCNGVDLRGSLQGVRAVVRMASAAGQDATRHSPRAPATLAGLARACVGAAVLLAFFGAEIEMRLGPKMDLVMSLAAIWAFWQLRVRRSGASTP